MSDTTTIDAARNPVPAPEQQSVATAASAQAEMIAETAILPTPAPTVPTPPMQTSAVTPTAAAPTGHANKAQQIEQNLAHFVGDRLPAAFAKGLMVDVVLANSNAVTGEGSPKDAHDIAITFKGGEFENPAKAQELGTLLRAALREHPAFANMGFAGEDQQIEHFMRCQILALEPAHLQELLTPQPAKHVTFVTPNPTQDVAITATAADAAKLPEQPQGETKPATLDAAPAGQVPAVAEAAKLPEQPVAETKPADLATAPTAQVASPADHQGMVANDKQMQLAG